MEENNLEAKDFGLKTQDVDMGNLPIIKAERDAYELQYKEIINLDIDDPETSKKAKDLRLKIVKNRTKGLNTWHKTTKDFFLKGGQFIDAIKNKEIAVNNKMEEDLKKIEDHAEDLRKEEINRVHLLRLESLFPYFEDTTGLSLGEMEEDVWEAFLSAKKASYERLEAEKKLAEEKRLAEEKAKKEEEEKIRKENEVLKKQAEEQRIKAMMEKEASDKALAEEKKKQAEKLAKERKAKLEAENKLKAIAEKEAQEKAELEAKLNQGDSENIVDFINELKNLKGSKTFKAKKNIELFKKVDKLIDKIVVFIEENK